VGEAEADEEGREEAAEKTTVTHKETTAGREEERQGGRDEQSSAGGAAAAAVLSGAWGDAALMLRCFTSLQRWQEENQQAAGRRAAQHRSYRRLGSPGSLRTTTLSAEDAEVQMRCREKRRCTETKTRGAQKQREEERKGIGVVMG
jgi:hypothetical protein